MWSLLTTWFTNRVASTIILRNLKNLRIEHKMYPGGFPRFRISRLPILACDQIKWLEFDQRWPGLKLPLPWNTKNRITTVWKKISFCFLKNGEQDYNIISFPTPQPELNLNSSHKPTKAIKQKIEKKGCFWEHIYIWVNDIL